MLHEAAQRLGKDFEFASSRVAAAWKFYAAQSQRVRDGGRTVAGLGVLDEAGSSVAQTVSESGSSVMMMKGWRAFLIAGSGKPRRGHEKRCGSPKQRRGHEGQARAGGHQKARKFSARKICPNLDSSSKTDLETRGKHRELKRKQRAPTQRKARAREEPSPGPPASETDARPLGHQPRGGARRARASAAAKRARPRKRASLARCKICGFGPELGFEQRNQFRSLRDTRRTQKKVLRKPPAGAPVVGQTFKYIY